MTQTTQTLMTERIVLLWCNKIQNLCCQKSTFL